MITSYSQVQHGDITIVAITSSYTGTVYFHWYLDGAFVSTTTTPSQSFMIGVDTQAHVDCLDTDDRDYQPPARLPDEYSARRTLWLLRSFSTDTAKYKIEQQEDGGDWTELGTVVVESDSWSYEFTTMPLTDLASIGWRITPIDTTDNEGSAVSIPARDIVRWPDAPDFTVAFDSGTARVTFTEAS